MVICKKVKGEIDWRISPNAHTASTSRTELEMMVAESALFSAAVLSPFNLAKLLLSDEEREDAMRRISSM